MATLNPITVSPNPVPSGQTATVGVTFTLTPGTSDLTADLSVFENGTLRGSVNGVVLQGAPGETTPVVTVGNTNTGWEIRTTAGTLTSLGGNTFRLAR